MTLEKGACVGPVGVVRAGVDGYMHVHPRKERKKDKAGRDSAGTWCVKALPVCGHNPGLPPRPGFSAEWQPAVQIFLYSLIFLLSVLGNTLVITVLIRNKRMRTVTNIFLLSLAISDLMLCLFCMPFNLIPNLLKDFIFGSALCKTTTYLMGKLLQVPCPEPALDPHPQHTHQLSARHCREALSRVTRPTSGCV